LPGWLALHSLPGIQTGSGTIQEATAICAAFSTIGVDPLEDHPLAVALRAHANGASLDHFARQLFELWVHAGMPPKDRWALGAIGLLGGLECAEAVIPYLRKWPYASRYTAAKLGYEGLLWVLRRGDSPEILWQLRQAGEGSTIALEFFKMLAIERDQTEHQLEDLILPKPPTCLFDYGPRQFEVRIAPDGSPVFLESNGERHVKPPKQNRTDDQAKAEIAREQMKNIEKELVQLRKFVWKRLEGALYSGARWNREDFERVVLPHPLYAPQCRLLVWGCFDEKNELTGTFRVTDDGRYAGVGDRPFDLPAGTRAIGLPKPSAFSADERELWRRIFDDYNLIPLGPQLSSPWPGLPPDFLDADALTLHAELSLPELKQALRTSGYSVAGGEYWTKSFASDTIVATFSNRAMAPTRVEARLFFRHEQGSVLTVRDLDPKVIQAVLSDVSNLQLRFETNS
jgi:hypothetical protein